MGSGAKYFHPAGARRTLVDGPFSAILLMASGASGGKLSLVEHPLAPRALGSPMHTHAREDEYSYILAGQIGAQVGDEVIFAGPGDVIAKPSGSRTRSGTLAMSPLGCWRSSPRGVSRTTSPRWANFSPPAARRTRLHGGPWVNGSGSTSISIPFPGSPLSTASNWTADSNSRYPS